MTGPGRAWLHAAVGSAALLFGHAAGAAEFDCITEPSQIVDIRASVEGLIDRLYADRGQMVAAGQVVASLDAGLEQANAELARYKSTMRGSIQSGESRVEYSGIKAGRSEQLHRERFISAQERDEAVTEKRLAEAQLTESKDNQRVAELEYARAKEQLRLRTLRSPIGGIVVERYMNVGELADNRDLRKPIMKIANISLLHVETLLPLEAHGKVKPGQVATVMPESPVGGKFPAKVKVVDKLVDTASGTFGVRLELPNAKLDIPAGVKCKVSFQDIASEAGPRPAARAKLPPPAQIKGATVSH